MERIKIRVKSELDITIKISDSKNVEVVSVMKEVESVVKIIGVKQQELQQMLAKQKLLFDFFFDRREDDLINQKIRTIRVLDDLNFFILMMTKQSLSRALQRCFLVRFRN